MNNFTPETHFVKWAAVQVSKFEDVPNGLEELTISSGKYAVFTFKDFIALILNFIIIFSLHGFQHLDLEYTIVLISK